MNRTAIALSIGILAGLPGAAFAQDGMMATPHAEAAPTKESLPDFIRANIEAMDAMHGPMMDGVMADDADVAFVRVSSQ